MNLKSFLRNLETDHEIAHPSELADGEQLVSARTAQALAELADAIAVQGLEDVVARNDDLFMAVARSLLPANHPGFTKRPKGMKEVGNASAETIERVDAGSLWPDDRRLEELTRPDPKPTDDQSQFPNPEKRVPPATELELGPEASRHDSSAILTSEVVK